MVETKSLEQSTKNWNDAIGRVPAAYAAGVSGASGVIAASIAAEELYAQKMQESIAAKRRAVKLAEVTDEMWKKASLDKGATRIGAGMTAAKPKFATGIGKVLDVLHGVTLPARVADPMQNVENRVKPIVSALAAMK